MEQLLIPLPRRIAEVMKERGKVSQEFVATRIGIHRDTFRAVLRGERPIYGTELQNLAQVLKVKVDRLNQTDIMKEITLLDRCLNRVENLDNALVIAQKFNSLAIGITERLDSLNYLGRVCYELKKYNEAHQHWTEAYDLALFVHLDYGETNRLHEVAKNLMVSYTIRKDFANAQQQIEQLRPYFHNHPTRMGVMYYSLAMIAFGNGDMEETKSCLHESLLYFKQTRDAKQIGNAEHNVGYIHYLLGDLSVARSMFEQAIRSLSHFSEPKLIAIKDYLKVLLKLGEQTKAQKLLQEFEDQISCLANRNLYTKFQLLKMIANHDLTVAHSIFSTNEANQNQKRIACRFLMEHYHAVDDLKSFMSYYEMERSLTEKIPLFDEEGL